MKKKLTLSALLLAHSLYGMSLDEIIKTSLSKSPSLSSIDARIEANQQNILVSDQFSNPEILLTKNSIDSSQAMSQTILSLKQKLPYPSKLETQKGVATSQDKILQERLHAAKVLLVSKIKNEAYTVWEFQELYKIIDAYIDLTEQNIALYESYTSINENQHMGIMKAKLSLSDLEVQKSALRAKISSTYARLSYLAAFSVSKLDLVLNIGQKPDLNALQSTLVNNPDILIREKEILKEEAKVKLADINNYPDFNIIAAYSYRENFNNYVNLGVGLSLPIYGTEDYKEEEAKATLLSAKSLKEDTKISINSTLKIYYAQMLSSYEIYHIIQDDALPQVHHMFELSNSSISTGADLFKYIDVLFQKLDLEQKSIKAVSNYSRARAEISKLAGEIK